VSRALSFEPHGVAGTVFSFTVQLPAIIRGLPRLFVNNSSVTSSLLETLYCLSVFPSHIETSPRFIALGLMTRRIYARNSYLILLPAEFIEVHQ
jgi:hypothetical protein